MSVKSSLEQLHVSWASPGLTCATKPTMSTPCVGLNSLSFFGSRTFIRVTDESIAVGALSRFFSRLSCVFGSDNLPVGLLLVFLPSPSGLHPLNGLCE